ncbi:MULTISPECIES: hypothetical protein [Priestia]|uniref:hypothetical protein n=1 Tax=Priestia TaxID=2800373 RepID=UPI001C8D7821|nr:hypothetical protein [Priestia aryabhattai]MBY0213843.1 hypothetical protein [Priestia aryabhattai]
MTKKNVGRKSKLSEDEVITVIKLFKKQEQPSGIIKYSEIHRFANSLFKQGVISQTTSDAFWRKEGRRGRKFVDNTNLVFSETLTTSKGENLVIPNICDLIEKKYKNKEELTKNLLFIERQFHQTLKREKDLKKKLVIAERKIQEEKEKKKAVEKTNIQLQDLVFTLYRTLVDISDPIIKERTESAMKDLFLNPTIFFNMEKKVEVDNENVLSIPNQKDEKNKISNRFRK